MLKKILAFILWLLLSFVAIVAFVYPAALNPFYCGKLLAPHVVDSLAGVCLQWQGFPVVYVGTYPGANLWATVNIVAFIVDIVFWPIIIGVIIYLSLKLFKKKSA